MYTKSELPEEVKNDKMLWGMYRWRNTFLKVNLACSNLSRFSMIKVWPWIYKLWIGNWTANQGSFLRFNLVDLVSSATIAVSRYPKQYRNSLRWLCRISENCILSWWTWCLLPPLLACSLGQNIVYTMSMEFQSPGLAFRNQVVSQFKIHMESQTTAPSPDIHD